MWSPSPHSLFKAMEEIFRRIFGSHHQPQSTGVYHVLVEQSILPAMEVADQVCVLESGRTVWKGAANQARADAGLIDVFLGLKK